MSNSNIPNAPKPKKGAASGQSGNLLSSVAPPIQLPNFITAPAPQAASENLIKNESSPQPATNTAQSAPSQTLSQSSSGDFIPTTFSPAIPAIKGIPTEAPPVSPPSPTLTSPSDSVPSLQSAHEASDLLGGDPMPGSGLLTWVRGAVSSGGLLHRVAEKAKNSVDSMITTLDPQMKEYIYSGGDIEIIVASDKDAKVSPIREGFQNVFGRATVIGIDSQPSKIAAQPVGFAAGLAAAKDRIGQLRASNAKIGNNVPIIAMESFVIEVTSDRWFELGVLVLTDPVLGITQDVYTQMTPIPMAVIAAAQGDTPEDYEHKETGFSTTIGSYMAANLQTQHYNWHEAAVGVSRRDIIYMAAKALASIYKKSISPATTT